MLCLWECLFTAIGIQRHSHVVLLGFDHLGCEKVSLLIQHLCCCFMLLNYSITIQPQIQCTSAKDPVTEGQLSANHSAISVS